MRFSEIIGGIKTVRRLWVVLLLGLGAYGLLHAGGITVGSFIENLSMGLAFGSIACFVGAVYLRYAMPIGYSIESVTIDTVLMAFNALALKWISTFALLPALSTIYVWIAYGCIGFFAIYVYAFRK